MTRRNNTTESIMVDGWFIWIPQKIESIFNNITIISLLEINWLPDVVGRLHFTILALRGPNGRKDKAYDQVNWVI